MRRRGGALGVKTEDSNTPRWREEEDEENKVTIAMMIAVEN